MNAIAHRAAEDRRIAAYWYATGRGMNHELATMFATIHCGEAFAYHSGATGWLPGVCTSFAEWSAR
jgi:hypothetical protein